MKFLAAKELPGPVYVVKAQIHAGGRGKAGGVKILNTIDPEKEAKILLDRFGLKHRFCI